MRSDFVHAWSQSAPYASIAIPMCSSKAKCYGLTCVLDAWSPRCIGCQFCRTIDAQLTLHCQRDSPPWHGQLSQRDEAGGQHALWCAGGGWAEMPALLDRKGMRPAQGIKVLNTLLTTSLAL